MSGIGFHSVGFLGAKCDDCFDIKCTPDQLSLPVLKVAAVSKICMGCNSPAPCNCLAIGGFVLEYLVHNNKETLSDASQRSHVCAPGRPDLCATARLSYLFDCRVILL